MDSTTVHPGGMAGLVDQIRDEGAVTAPEVERDAVARFGFPITADSVTSWIAVGLKCRTGQRIRLAGYRAGRPYVTSWPALIRFFGESERLRGGDDVKTTSPRLTPGRRVSDRRPRRPDEHDEHDEQ